MKQINEIDIKVGQQLRARRSQIGFTQQSLATALGLSFQQIQKYESGVNRVSASKLFAMCQVLKCQPNYFFGIGEEYQERDASKQDRGRLELLKAYNSIEKPRLRAIVRNIACELSRLED